MKLLMVTRYSILGASSRVRFFQYIPYLRSLGWEIEVLSFLDDSYLQQLYENKSRSVSLIIKSYFDRFNKLLRKADYEIIWIEKELMQWMPAWVESYLLGEHKNRYLVDYDDAIFHNYDLHSNRFIRNIYRNKIRKIMANAYCVLAGNDYIAKYAIQANANRVEILPTVVDLGRYSIASKAIDMQTPFSIGWIGSPSTAKYLKIVENPIRILAERKNIELCVIGVKDAPISGFPIRYIDWSENTEVENISKLDVGIMPLIDSPWERGKCGYKLIQYMACGKPVIASPVGVNSSIVQNGVNGYLAKSDKDWVDAVCKLYDNRKLASGMGLSGRGRVEEVYSLQATAPQLAKILTDGSLKFRTHQKVDK